MHVTGLLSPASLPPAFPQCPLHGRGRGDVCPCSEAVIRSRSPGREGQGKPALARPVEGGMGQPVYVCLRPALETWVWYLMPLYQPVAG